MLRVMMRIYGSEKRQVKKNITVNTHTHTHTPVLGCPWTEDRWWRSGSGPGSDAVLYHYNLLCSMLPTAVKDNMFHPLRAHSETALQWLYHTRKLTLISTVTIN